MSKNSNTQKHSTIQIKTRVIHLAYRVDRTKTIEQLEQLDWNYSIYDAIYGKYEKIPDWWSAGAGAYGCYLSHRGVWKIVSASGMPTLILEDDAFLPMNFKEKVRQAFGAVPRDWDLLYIGGQHLKTDIQAPKPCGEFLVKGYNINRNHAYILNNNSAQKLLELTADPSNFTEGENHIDHALGHCMERGDIIAYGANPFFVAQDAGYSDICNKEIPFKFWR